MPKHVVYTDRLMRPIANFSHASRVGDIVHVGATAGVFPNLRLAGDSAGRIDVVAQTRKMFENLETALRLNALTGNLIFMATPEEEADAVQLQLRRGLLSTLKATIY